MTRGEGLTLFLVTGRFIIFSPLPSFEGRRILAPWTLPDWVYIQYHPSMDVPTRKGIRTGRGAVSNPTGRFEPTRAELVDDGWGNLDEELPPLATTVVLASGAVVVVAVTCARASSVTTTS